MIPVPASTLGSMEKVRITAAFRLIETRHVRDLRLCRHAHQRAGVTIVLGGAYRERIGAEELDCRAGSIVFKPAGAVHGNRYGPFGAHALHVEIAAPVLGEDPPRLPERTIELDDARTGYIAAELAREFRIEDAISSLAIDALGMELVARLARLRPRSGRAAPAWLEHARSLLHETTWEPLSLRDVAATVGVPPRRVARDFRRCFGCSVGQYARRVRVERAARSLRESDRPIARIAAETGFTDQAHLTRVFRREIGVTPAAYRRSCR